MKRYPSYLLFFTIVFCAFGCQKSEMPPSPPCLFRPCDSRLELIPITDTCFEPLPPNTFGIRPLYFGQEIQYQFPAFDPTTYEQFLYFHGEHIPGSQLVDFPLKGANFCTGEVWTIIDSIQFSSYLYHLPHWSEKGWILMMRWVGLNLPGERGLYKIKPDGDSLTFLINKNVVYPIWIENGEKIYCINLDSPFNHFILNSDGEQVDSFPFQLAPSSFYEGKFAGLIFSPDLKLVIIENKVITNELWSPDQTNYDFNGLDWLNQDEIVWITSKGIYRGNVNTGQIELVKEVCPNIFYSSISAARDGSNRLLLTRRDYLFENGITDSMSVRYNISLYDMDTGEEFYVKLGEM